MTGPAARGGRPARVGVLVNDDGALAAGGGDEAVAASLEAATAIAAALGRAGLDVALVRAPGDPAALLAAVRAADAACWFNLCESLRGDARLEAAVAWLLELEGVAYTGSPPRALALALEKPLCRAALREAGVPVPRGAVLALPDDPLVGPAPPRPGRPWIVKPAREDASHGVALESVVTGEAAARARAAWVIETFRQPALVEEWIDGRELNVSLLERPGAEDPDGALEVLPLAEIDFSAWPAGAPRVVTYDAKWRPDSPEYRGSPSVAAGPLEPALAARVREVARAAFRAVGLRDYGRVDLRLCAADGPLVIDVNPNPDLSPDAGLARAAARGGLSHDDLCRTIVDRALARRALARREAGAPAGEPARAAAPARAR